MSGMDLPEGDLAGGDPPEGRGARAGQASPGAGAGASPPVALVVAMDEGRLIGVENRLPWRLPADLRHFRRLTWGHAVIMGRRTFESIGRPLAGRHNLVVSRRAEGAPAGVELLPSLEAALARAAALAPGREALVIGGMSLYRQALPLARRIYLTEVHARFRGDAHFPPLEGGRWREAAREDHPADAENPVPYSFVVLERTEGGAGPR